MKLNKKLLFIILAISAVIFVLLALKSFNKPAEKTPEPTASEIPTTSATTPTQRTEQNKHSSLKPQKPSTKQMNVPVLSLKYFPLDPNNPNQLDRGIIGNDLSDTSLSFAREKVKNLQNAIIEALEKGSAYHGYKDNASKSLLDYSIFEEKEFLKGVPIGTGTGSRPADHIKILQGEGFNICDYVEHRGVKEVWVWMYHSNVAYPVESYQTGPYGGIGNGFMNLPLCKKTYTVYDYNYGRGIGEVIEDHSHHIEIIFRSINAEIFNKFVGGQLPPFACGWVHYPPNVMQYTSNHDYDWANETSVSSDCEDWNPERSGEKKQISCHTWAGAACGNDSGDKFKVWWMQNVPSSWWVWIGDYDRAKKEDLGLRNSVLKTAPISQSNGTELKDIKYTLPQGWEVKIQDGRLLLSPINGGGFLSIKVYDYPSNIGRREYYCQITKYCLDRTYFTEMNIGNISGYSPHGIDNSGGGAEYFGAKGNKFYIVSSFSPPSPNDFDENYKNVLNSLIF